MTTLAEHDAAPPAALFINAHEGIEGASPLWVEQKEATPAFRMYGLFPLAAPPTGEPQAAEAEFELHVAGDYACSATGPRVQAWREILHYASQYAPDGPLTVYEVTRREVTAAALPAAPKKGQP